MDLSFPEHLSEERRALLVEVAERNDRRHGADFLGMVLSGSAGRGMTTDISDVDVYVVLTDQAGDGLTTSHSTLVDEIPYPISELAEVAPFHTEGWWSRWSFAWAPVLLDRTGRLPEILHSQATVTEDEARAILVDHDRLDGWLNYAFRALKSDRDGRALECRLDAVESVPWLLDTVFTFARRVRPYHKYLPWELREHPLPGWDADTFLDLLQSTMDGDPAALRATFARVEELCSAYDAVQPAPVLMPIVADWGESQLSLFRA